MPGGFVQGSWKLLLARPLQGHGCSKSCRSDGSMQDWETWPCLYTPVLLSVGVLVGAGGRESQDVCSERLKLPPPLYTAQQKPLLLAGV